MLDMTGPGRGGGRGLLQVAGTITEEPPRPRKILLVKRVYAGGKLEPERFRNFN